MKILVLLLFFVFLVSAYYIAAQDTLIIQEETTGVCTMDGAVDSSLSCTGFTGIGYVDIDAGYDIGMSWSVNVYTSGTYEVAVRYALGGSDTLSRNAGLYINYALVDTMLFPHTSYPGQTWDNWQMADPYTVNLDSGQYTILLSSITHKGLANLDYFRIIGPDSITPAECVPPYTFSVGVNNPDAGTVSYEPVQQFYMKGTEITVQVDTIRSGYFFHSWSGEEASTDTLYSFQIKENTAMTALFYPEGTTMSSDIYGYAAIQHENGTPYLLIGGALGDTVEATRLGQLDTLLGDEYPHVVKLSKYLTGSSANEIKVNSNKTLIGTNDMAYIKGVGLSINGARNVIIKNVTISHVLAGDEIEINGGSKNVWIDHCELFTDRDHDDNEDYYDGLLDIKNASSFITVSWSYFHDHNKGVLICSGDDSLQDSVQRITFHHNYFDSCNSRLPSIRFGKSHIFNNFYENNGTCVNTRMNACVKVEKNYFRNNASGVAWLYSPITGNAELEGNIFENTSHADLPVCALNVPYPYESHLDSAADLPALIPANIRAIPTSLRKRSGISNYSLYSYPNPASGSVTVSFKLPQSMFVTVSVYDMFGNEVQVLGNKVYNGGRNEIIMDISGLDPGIYLYRLKTGEATIVKRLVVR